jgi:acid stress-induced BolA-like protein IbaG/YrbA
MMQPETIKHLIEQEIADCEAYVEGNDGTHFQAIVVSEQFAGKTPVQQHQVVYRALGDRMGTEIHALSLQTYTPEQWAGVRGLR